MDETKVPEGWRKITVAEFVDKMRSGGTPKSDNHLYYDGNIPFVAIEDMTKSNKYLDSTEKKISRAGLSNCSAWLVPKKSLLYSIYATLGVPRINLIEVTTNQAILNIIPNEKIADLEFLYYAFLQKRNTILAHSVHTTQSNLNAKTVRELEFTIPKSIVEQQEIARVLSNIDRAIAEIDSLIEKQNRIKTGLMQDLLTKGIDEQGNVRNEDTHKFKNSPLGRIPQEWNTIPINNLCVLIVDCKNRTSPFVEQSSYPVIRTSNIKNGSLNWDDMKYTDKASYRLWTERAIPQYEDVIITREAPLGQALKIPLGLTPILGQRTMMYRLDKSKLTPDFLVNSILLNKMQSYFNQISGGSTVHHLKVGEMKQFLLSIPASIEEQNRIDRKLNEIGNAIKILSNESNKLQSLRTGLMQDLLSGKVRVNHLLTEENTVASI